MEEPSAARLPAPHTCGRGADRERLSCRRQHAARPSCAHRAVWRRGRQGYGEKGDWDAWNARALADEPIMRLVLDGTVVRVRLDRKATAISLLVVIGVRADGQKVLLAVRSMGGESAEA